MSAAIGLRAAVERVRIGGLLAFPTETVWGLGADARSDAAVGRLQRWKGRAESQPIALLVTGPGALASLGLELPELGARLVQRYWPGPLTLVLPGRGGFAGGVAREDGAVGVRCSPHPAAAALARALEAAGVGPLTATSLNRHGEPPARTRDEARRLCGGGEEDQPQLLDVEEADAAGGPPSTVVDLVADGVRVLRYGALGPEEIDPWLSEICCR